jgi:hypothetical protein
LVSDRQSGVENRTARGGIRRALLFKENGMTTFDLTALHAFIIRAKAATYVGSGQHLLPYRLGSHDLQFVNGDWLVITHKSKSSEEMDDTSRNARLPR